MKRVLFVSRQFPSDIAKSVHGVYMRMRLFLDALMELSEALDVLFYVEPGVDSSAEAMRRAEADIWAAWGIRANITLCPVEEPSSGSESLWHHYVRPTFSLFAQSLYAGTSAAVQVVAFEAALERHPDAVFVHRLDAMCPVLLTRRSCPPVFLDLDDIEHVRWVRQLRQGPFWPGKRLYYLHLPALVAGERRAVSFSTRTFVCSEFDRRYLTKLCRMPRVVTIPNAVTMPDHYGIDSASMALLFLGTYAYLPNAAAADFLIREVWPLVRDACSGARLIIAGNKPERIASFAGGPPGVEFTGFVDNLEELYRRVRVVCCPVMSGGGTRLKIIEAAAYGKVIVSTRVGAEGLDLRDGEEIILRDGARAFAEACIDLLKDLTRCRAMGLAARKAVEPRYDRRHIVSRIKDTITEGLKGRM
jgi:glycosyltransferase involved in cell wall biosynthesis